MLKGRAAGTLEPVKPEALLGPCWHYVGSFFALGRLFLALGRLLRVCKAFFTYVRLFFRVLGRSGSDFGLSRDDFEGAETLFFNVLSRAQACDAKTLRMCRNHNFS